MQYVGVAHASIFAAVGTLTGYLSSFVSAERCRITSQGWSLLAWSKITEFTEVASQLRSDTNVALKQPELQKYSRVKSCSSRMEREGIPGLFA